jgi:LysM repeat protein
MKKAIQLFILLIIYNFSVFAGGSKHLYTPEKYVQDFKSNAIKEMILYNIPASITLAQGMLESEFGASDLALKANNHFGIKCHKEWSGPCFIKDDDEKDECFRKYNTVLESYTDHSQFLLSRPWYAKLFLLGHTDYKGWAKGLKDAGYATDPRYPQRLIWLINTYQLYKFDVAVAAPEAPTNTFAKEDVVAPEKTIVAEQTKIVEPVIAKPIVKADESKPREILRMGIVKYIIIKPNDTFLKIAKETDKDLWQLYKYNDMEPTDKLVAGQKLFLQPKRRNGADEFYIVKAGETMKSISQAKGIKLKLLYSKNNMVEGQQPSVGQKLYLQGQKE